MNRIFVFEGIDGAGKSTSISNVFDKIQKQNLKVKIFREPGLYEGAKEIGEEIRLIINKLPISDAHQYTRLFLTIASRNELLNAIHSLDNHIILLDRFFYSTYAYQHYGYGIPKDIIDLAHSYLPLPVIEKVFLFDINPVDTINRGKKFTPEKLNFMNKVRDGYLNLIQEEEKNNKEKKFIIIDAKHSAELILDKLLSEINLYA